MSRTSLFVCLFLLPAAIALATAPSGTRPVSVSELPIDGATLGVAAVDTTLLVGSWRSGAPVNGQFQSPGVAPAWNGWAAVDLSDPGGNHWVVSTRTAVNGVYSAWCGDPDIPSCGPGDPEGGYGNDWYDMVYWQAPVADPALPCTVRVQALVNLDSEEAYDYGMIQVVTTDGLNNIWYDSGDRTALPVDATFVFEPSHYLGDDADQVRVHFTFMSDGAASDEDCLYAQASAGAMNFDDVVITLSNGTGYSHDFEDGTWGAFVPVPRDGTGSFGKIWTDLDDLDECHENSSPQVAFIDDGVVVPGTGGTRCLDWCYGPGGFVVNHTGGVSYEEESRLHSVVVSPPLTLPPGSDDILLAYDTYRHDGFAWVCGAPSCLPNLLPWEGIRSVATGDPADLEYAEWIGPDYVYLAEPGTYRVSRQLGHKLVPGATHVQVALGVRDYSPIGWHDNAGENSSPAPYVDNVRIVASPRPGPVMTTLPRQLARDGFPSQGHVDLVNLGSNSVRFDMIDGDIGTGTLVPNDSLLVRIEPRDGATVSGTPRLHYRLFRNEIFDPHRTAGMPDLGSADLVIQAGASWTVDLPDEGFLFPGDVLHYYFDAMDDLAGDIRTSFLPADTTGFSGDTWHGMHSPGYDPAFTVRALPSAYADAGNPGTYRVPQVLLWHDSGTDDDWDEWRGAIHQAFGAILGQHYDIYDAKTTHPDARALGSTVTTAHLGVYGQVFYAGGLEDTSLEADLPLVESWLQLGGKDLFLTGHRVADDLEATFTAWSGTSVAGTDLRLLVGGQMAPRTETIAANPVLATVNNWLAFGECPDMAPASAVTTTGGGSSLVQYLDPLGNLDVYPYTALVLNVDAATGSRVITLPWDFAHVHTDPLENYKSDATQAARVRMLADILSYFGVASMKWIATDVPLAGTFAVSPRPNPFNPSTTISYAVERPGHLLLRIFDLRGALVATLVDVRVEQSGQATWLGRDNSGAHVASGVYFYEARMHGDVRRGKLALLK
ncbi:MAG: hypothetical protein GY838_10865 [bacterium]|nr:hypothetical protein [bacterium]